MTANEIITEAHKIVARDSGKLGLPKNFAFNPAVHDDEFQWAVNILEQDDLDGVFDDD